MKVAALWRDFHSEVEDMKYGIIKKSTATVWGVPSETEIVEGQERSAIADEALYGMGLSVVGEAENGYYPVRTHYGYEGYVREDDVRIVTLEEMQAWEASRLMIVSGICVDVTSIPKVQGILLESLFRGALLKVLEFDSGAEADDGRNVGEKSSAAVQTDCKKDPEKSWPVEGAAGWARVELVDGRIGYIRNQYLMEKKFSQAGLWEEKLPQSFLKRRESALSEDRKEGSLLQSSERLEAEFRDAVVRTAMTYLGVQYRWGGKSTAGIDCSGLTSMSYMLNGVLTYRDAQIKPEFPVHEIPREQMKKGDLMYFPGHIALYIGDQRYIHSTGRIGSGGVVINSMNPLDPDYREDLVKCMYAAGSIF